MENTVIYIMFVRTLNMKDVQKTVFQMPVGHWITFDMDHIKIYEHPEQNNFLKYLHLYYF